MQTNNFLMLSIFILNVVCITIAATDSTIVVNLQTQAQSVMDLDIIEKDASGLTTTSRSGTHLEDGDLSNDVCPKNSKSREQK